MTRLFTEGGEFGDMLGWNVATGGIVTTKRSGAYAFNNSIGGGEYTFQKNFTGVDEIYVRTGIYITYSSNGYLMGLRNGTTVLGYIKHDSATNKLSVYSGSPNGTLLATGNITFSQGTWYLIEWHLKLADSGGVSEVKIDGVLDMTFTGDTKPGSDTTIDNFYFHSGSGWAALYLDDVAINNTSNADGKGDNSWCGDGHIEILMPNGNGSLNQWTGSDGNSTDNYALVDELPASSADYVENATAGQQDKYAVADFTATNKQVLRIWAEARAIDTAAEGAQMKLGVRTNSTDYVSAAKTLLTSYTPIKGDEYKLNPADSGAWEDADLDGIELVLETV